MRARQIVDGIAGGPVDEKPNDRAKRDLIGDAADLGVVVERYPRGGRPRRKVNRHLPLVGLATPLTASTVGSPGPHAAFGDAASTIGQRIGGAYWMPPLFHNLFRPRSILSGEPCPTLRSNNSP